MGRGNFLPSNLEGEIGYEMIYISIPEPDSEYTCEIECEDFVQMLEEEILNVLPKSYFPEQRYVGDRYVIAQNDVTSIYLADNQYSLALVIHPRFSDYFPTHRFLAVRHLEGTMNKIKTRLKELNYQLSIRTSSWTSAQI